MSSQRGDEKPPGWGCTEGECDCPERERVLSVPARFHDSTCAGGHCAGLRCNKIGEGTGSTPVTQQWV